MIERINQGLERKRCLNKKKTEGEYGVGADMTRNERRKKCKREMKLAE